MKRLFFALVLALLPFQGMAQQAGTAFLPSTWAASSIAVTTTSARVVLPAGTQCRLYNAGTATVSIRMGTVSVVALTTDYPLPSGAIEVVGVVGTTVPTNIAAITSSGTATLYVNCGTGV